MGLIDSFDWAMHKALRACEERRLDPPAEVKQVECRACEGHGFIASMECPKCDGTGQMIWEDGE